MNMDEMIQHSFKDYHAKGLDYLCVKRTPEHTVKYYFFAEPDPAEQIVAPHDHRYPFTTRVLAGGMVNHLYQEHPIGKPFNRFEFMTPLNGGNGFTWAGETRLIKREAVRYARGTAHGMFAPEIHTISIRLPGTVIRLDQRADVLPIDTPTSTYFVGRESPSLSGLYAKFTPDEITSRLAILNKLTGKHYAAA